MNEQNTRQSNALAGLTIQTDIALWQLLLQGIKKSHKLSRVEAFYDLIGRHCIAMLKGEDDHISGTIHNGKVMGMGQRDGCQVPRQPSAAWNGDCRHRR